MRFRIDIECAAAQRSSTTTTTWDGLPRDRCDPRAEEDHVGSAPVGGLIKLVQLLIRWKAFNLDNLLTTWPTHYTFPISDNPQQGKKHSPIPCRRLDTVPTLPPHPPHDFLARTLALSNRRIVQGGSSPRPPPGLTDGRAGFRVRRHVEEIRFVTRANTRVKIEEEFDRGG